jgi:Uma2 family endonuclease
MAEAAKSIRYTWADYRQWPEDQRWEIIGGDAYEMSPSPSPRHQMIAFELGAQMHTYFKGKRCRVLPSPVDVRLSRQDIVGPDLVVVCDPKQIKASHIEGTPALVVEILSPSTTIHDRLRKRGLYARAGVREYWIVTPFPPLVEVLRLKRGQYVIQQTQSSDGTLTSPSFAGLRVDLRDVFDIPAEPGEEPLRMVREPPSRYTVPSRRAPCRG